MFDAFIQSQMIFTGINIIAAFSFYLPFKTGQVSLGQAGFMAIGAYASGIVTVKWGLPFPFGLAFGAIVAAIIGLGVGFPALRIKGIYLLLLTLGFAQIVQVAALTWSYTGAASGFQGIPQEPNILAYVIGTVVVLALLFRQLERSSLGRAMTAIHSDEDAAELMGVDIVRMKLLAFSVGAGIGGIAGALFAHMTTYVDSTTFDILLGVQILMFVVVGGGTTYWGPIVGASILTLLPEFLRSIRGLMESVPESWTSSPPWDAVYQWLYDFLNFENEKRWILYGLILILMMILRPQGLLTRGPIRLPFIGRRRRKPVAAQ
jgi:branched-chain amino acid transport system permease protein